MQLQSYRENPKDKILTYKAMIGTIYYLVSTNT